MIRLTSFPILLLIAWYERQAKQSGSITFRETLSSAAEKIFDALPRSLKRLCELKKYQSDIRPLTVSCAAFFEGLAGSEADIDAVRSADLSSVTKLTHDRYLNWRKSWKRRAPST